VADLLERLTPEHVAAHPLTLLEAVDQIKHLREELARANRWIGVIEGAMIAQIHDSEDREKREE
jgi:hypothetical protein